MLKGLFGKADAISREGGSDTVDLIEARARAGIQLTDDELDFLEMRDRRPDEWAGVDLVEARSSTAPDLLTEAKEAVRLMAEKGIGFNETGLRAAIERQERVHAPIIGPAEIAYANAAQEPPELTEREVSGAGAAAPTGFADAIQSADLKGELRTVLHFNYGMFAEAFEFEYDLPRCVEIIRAMADYQKSNSFDDYARLKQMGSDETGISIIKFLFDEKLIAYAGFDVPPTMTEKGEKIYDELAAMAANFGADSPPAPADEKAVFIRGSIYTPEEARRETEAVSSTAFRPIIKPKGGPRL